MLGKSSIFTKIFVFPYQLRQRLAVAGYTLHPESPKTTLQYRCQKLSQICRPKSHSGQTSLLDCCVQTLPKIFWVTLKAIFVAIKFCIFEILWNAKIKIWNKNSYITSAHIPHDQYFIFVNFHIFTSLWIYVYFIKISYFDSLCVLQKSECLRRKQVLLEYCLKDVWF